MLDFMRRNAGSWFVKIALAIISLTFVFFLGQGGDGQEDDAAKSKSGCGKCCGRVPTNLCLHHPEFNLDEEVMKRGVALFVNLALRSLKDLSAAANNDTDGEPVRTRPKSASFRIRESELD